MCALSLYVAILLKKTTPPEILRTIPHCSQHPCLPVNCSALPVVLACTLIHSCSLDLCQILLWKTHCTNSGEGRVNGEAAEFLRNTFCAADLWFLLGQRSKDLSCSHYKAEEITGIRWVLLAHGNTDKQAQKNWDIWKDGVKIIQKIQCVTVQMANGKAAPGYSQKSLHLGLHSPQLVALDLPSCWKLPARCAASESFCAMKGISWEHCPLANPLSVIEVRQIHDCPISTHRNKNFTENWFPRSQKEVKPRWWKIIPSYSATWQGTRTVYYSASLKVSCEIRVLSVMLLNAELYY